MADINAARPGSSDWASEVRRRLAGLEIPPAREAAIVDELSQHLDDRFRERIAGGASPDEATRVTLAEFTDQNRLARYIAALRQAQQPPPVPPGVHGSHVLDDLWRDLRYALRAMAARPGFAAVAILTLALGIGANTAIFGLWTGVLHASLPVVHEPGGLVMLSNPDQRGSWTGWTDGVRSWLTYEEFEQLRDHADAFSVMMASQSSLNRWQIRFDGSSSEEASGRLVSGEFFQVLGVGAAIGRVFTSAENSGAPPYAVISHSYWQRRFGGDAAVLGRTFALRKATLTIIGVAPRGFIGETSGQEPDVWLPLRMQPIVLPGRDRLHDTPPDKSMWLHVFARLKPGVTPAQAEAQANAVFQSGLQDFYGARLQDERRKVLDQRLQVRPGARGASATRPAFSQSLTALMAAVGVLLLITCANLANLLLARGTGRMPEIALRLSLGASRGRLVRQLVTESLALAVMGAAGAIAVAFALHGALVRMMAQSDSSFQMGFALDPLVLAFLVVAAFGATMVFGLLPAWLVTRIEAGATLKEQGRGAGGTRGQLRSGRLLVSVQLALSLPLLVGAGLLARTAYNLQHADLGFPADRLLLVRVDLREAGYDATQRDGLIRTLHEEMRRIPGVRAASYSQLGVFSGGESSSSVDVEGYTPKGEADRESARDAVGPGYFTALGAPITLGRDFLDSDRAGAPRVCVINEAFARRFFENRNPVGMRINEVAGQRTICQIVGVTGNARTESLRGDTPPRYYVAASQPPAPMATPIFLIRTGTDAASVMTTVRRTIQRVDGALPILSATTIEQQMAPLTAQDLTTARLAAVFGAVALTLSAIGLYGLLSYGVARRTGEIAIRLALGAPAWRVISMILRETIGLVAIGLAFGGVLAYSASRWITSRLYGVEPQDPLTLGASLAVLLAVALAAAYLPARRASKLDPVVALHQS
jgi:predicted permease